MTGLSSIGVYLPRPRLERSKIAAAWGTRQPAGERTVANYDEDALTMAVEAAHQLCHVDLLLDQREVRAQALAALHEQAIGVGVFVQAESTDVHDLLARLTQANA